MQLSTPNIENFRDEVFSSVRLTKLLGVNENCTDLEFIQAAMRLEQEIGFKDRLNKVVIAHVMKEISQMHH